jgi:NAD(P)-dependent dehydrogenase (short-subunit alcohol dehydrogenase family)
MGTYVVTGCASGIGAATAELLRAHGHAVVGIDRAGAEVTVDLAQAKERERAVTEVAARVSESAGAALDGLVCCAGIPGAPGRDGADLVSVNYFGTVDLMTGLRPLLAASGGSPSAVAISSNAVTCQPGWPAEVADACLAGDEGEARKLAGETEAVHVYPATKAALAWWTRQRGVGDDWIGAGIRLNAVAPGLVATAMTEEMRRDPAFAEMLDAYPLPVGRPGRPEEVAAAIAFLLSPQASLCCGTVLFVDGGTDALFHPRSPQPMG